MRRILWDVERTVVSILRCLVAILFAHSLLANDVIASQQLSLESPGICEEGSQCPIEIRATPSIKTGQHLVVSINDRDATIISVLEGSLSSFSLRLSIPIGNSTLKVSCVGCENTEVSRRIDCRKFVR